MLNWSRSIALAAALVFTSTLSSYAVPLVPPTFSGPGGTGSFSDNVTGAFTEDFTFSLIGPGLFSAAVTGSNAFTAAGGFIQGFAMSIFSGTPASPGGVAIPGTLPTIGLFGQSILFGGTLAAGDYFLRVSGTGITGANAGLGGSVSFSDLISSTPLPTTLSLFAAGLGVIGFLALRRRRSSGLTI